MSLRSKKIIPLSKNKKPLEQQRKTQIHSNYNIENEPYDNEEGFTEVLDTPKNSVLKSLMPSFSKHNKYEKNNIDLDLSEYEIRIINRWHYFIYNS